MLIGGRHLDQGHLQTDPLGIKEGRDLRKIGGNVIDLPLLRRFTETQAHEKGLDREPVQKILLVQIVGEGKGEDLKKLHIPGIGIIDEMFQEILGFSTTRPDKNPAPPADLLDRPLNLPDLPGIAVPHKGKQDTIGVSVRQQRKEMIFNHVSPVGIMRRN